MDRGIFTIEFLRGMTPCIVVESTVDGGTSRLYSCTIHRVLFTYYEVRGKVPYGRYMIQTD